MVVIQDGIGVLKTALNIVQDIQDTIFSNSPKKSINTDDLKEAGKDKLSKDMYSFIDKLKNVKVHVNSMLKTAASVNKDMDLLKAENEKLGSYMNIMDLIDGHMGDWRNTIIGDGTGTPRITGKINEEDIGKQWYFIGLRSNDKCTTCEKVPVNPSEDVICCDICRNHFHAKCLKGDKEKQICISTTLKQYKMKSTPKNFKWMCDLCCTRFEQEIFTTVQTTAATLGETVNKLSSQMDELKTDMDSNFSEINKSISGTNVWSDKTRVSSLKSALLIKPDKNGKPVELPVIRDLAIRNGIQVNKTVVTEAGNTFINLPSAADREKLTPLLQTSSVVSPDQIVNLKEKLPTISIVGIEEEITKDTASEYVLGQNKAIEKLVEDGEIFHVVFVKKPGEYSKTYTLVARVTPRIRDEIRRLGNKLYIGLARYQVRDRFYVKRCNNCQSYHHYENTCEKNKQCGYCRSQEHASISCPLKNGPLNQHSCCNCESSGKVNYKGHNTMWYRCPTYQEEQDKLRKSINYNYPDMKALNLHRPNRVNS